MNIQRREFLKDTVFGAALLAVLGYWNRASAAQEALKKLKLKFGACDWSLGKMASPEAFPVAKELGLEGVEVSCGTGKEKLPICDPERQKVYLEAVKTNGVSIISTCLEILHRDGVKNHPDGPKWVEQAIEPTRALGAKVILLPFFGGNGIEKRSEQKAVAERLKPIAKIAEKAGVILGLENTISAEDNAWILEQVGSPALQVYYDVGNSFPRFDVYNEVPWLGKDRICQIHLKDRGPLGKGKIDFPRFFESILKSGYEGWAVLETSRRTMKDDTAYVKKLLAEVNSRGIKS